MLPKLICLTAAGFNVRPSFVRGVFAPLVWLDGDAGADETSREVSGRDCRKGREKPKATKSGRARVKTGDGRRTGWTSMSDGEGLRRFFVELPEHMPTCLAAKHNNLAFQIIGRRRRHSRF
jgi:hypothetical protein